MSDDLTTQTGGQLLALPSEVRLLIYEMIFPPCQIDIYQAATGFRYGRDDHGRHPALLAVCRTIYTEAKPVLYGNTDFHMWCGYRSEFEIADTEDALSEDSLSEGSPSEDSLSEDSLSENSLSKNQSHEEPSPEDPELSERILGAKPLIHEMRKLSLDITLTDANSWSDIEAKGKWYRQATSDVTFLLEAPHLKQVHIELSATDGPGIAAELNQMIGLLSQVMHRAAPTISIDSSLRATDFEPSTYFDLITKRNWVDTTHEICSTKLAGLAKESLRILRKVQSRSDSIATKSAEHRDMVNNDNFHLRDAALRERAQSISSEIKLKNAQITRLEDELDDLAAEVASVEEDLEWIVAGRSGCADTEMTGSDGVLIAGD